MPRLLLIGLLFGLMVGSWQPAAAQVSFKHENSVDNLRKLYAYAATLNAAEREDQAVALSKSLWPTDADIAMALGPKVTIDTRKVIQAAYSGTRLRRARSTVYWATMIGVPSQTAKPGEVITAMVEDFEKAAAADDRSLPGAQFKMHPRTAASLLEPGVKFYAMQFVDDKGGIAGANAFYFWNGKQWKILYDFTELVTVYQLTNPDHSLRNVDLSPAEFSGFKQQNTKENLQKLLELLSKSVRSRNLNVAAAIAYSLMPQGKSLDAALSDKVNDATRTRIRATLPVGQVDRYDILLWSSLYRVRPKQTEVFVAGATTEEIKEYKRESVAWYNFPGGAREAAQNTLRPGMTFYIAKMLEPGQRLGMRYDLFYWDGESWKMLGKVWRALMPLEKP